MKTAGEPPTAGLKRARLPLILLSLVGLVLVLTLNYFAGDFLVNLWGPSHLLLHGQSPYRVDLIFPGKNAAVWFPQAIGLFFPLGWLDARVAANLWFVWNAVLFVVLMRWYSRERTARVPLLATALLLFSPPLLMQMLLGQFDLLIVVLFLLAARLVDRERYLLAGALVAVTLSKPQLAILAVPGLALAGLRRGKVKGVLLLGGAALTVSVLLAVPLWIGYPRWFADFYVAQQHNPSWLQPTLYTLAEVLGGKPWQVVPALMGLGFLGVNLWLWWRYPAEEAMPWSLALTTLASPYIWTWDFTLLLPLILVTINRQRSWRAGLAWTAGWLACWGLVGWIYTLTRGAEGVASTQWHFWIPWLALLLVLGTHAVESRVVGRQPLLRGGAGSANDPAGPG